MIKLRIARTEKHGDDDVDHDLKVAHAYQRVVADVKAQRIDIRDINTRVAQLLRRWGVEP